MPVRPISPQEPFQRAYFFKKKYGYSDQLLKNAAVKGLIRVKVPEVLDAPVTFCVADVLKLREKRVQRKRFLLPTAELALAAGN
jgi:hypothetical protein